MNGEQLVTAFTTFANHSHFDQARNNFAHLPLVHPKRLDNIRLRAAGMLLRVVVEKVLR